MITLYGKTGCPYTIKVITKLDDLKLSFTKLNIANDSVAEELLAKGGKHQVPYLIDGDIAMYESDDIIAYLDKTYGDRELGHGEVHVHNAGGTCSSCSIEEGG